MINFGHITRSDCVNIPVPPDGRCADPAFALAHPDICPVQPRLVLKPGIALACPLGSIQFRAFYITRDHETDVTNQSIFTSSNLGIALVGVSSGNATALAQGVCTISATYQGLTAYAELDVIGSSSENCCDSVSVAMMVMVDTTRSMSLAFGGGYASRLAYAKAAATRFISEINESKDLIGLMTFNAVESTVLASPIADKAIVGSLVSGITQTQQKTTFYNALVKAIAELNTVSADRKVIVLMTDGEDTDESYGDDDNPIALLDDFKSQGGIVICLGIRASGTGYNLLEVLATGGFFINGYPATADVALDYLSGLKGYICAGNCTPEGDILVPMGALNYRDFLNWIIPDGQSLDLQGNDFFDYLPGNGLYVDLICGQVSTTSNPAMVSRSPFSLTSGHNYRLCLELAGNQVVDRAADTVRVQVFWRNTDVAQTPVLLLDQQITMADWKQPFQKYAFTFPADADREVWISIQQTDVPTSAPLSNHAGVLLGSVQFDDVTDLVNLLTDNFDAENLTYVPPRCGPGTIPAPVRKPDSLTFTDAGTAAVNGEYLKVSDSQWDKVGGGFNLVLIEGEKWFLYDAFAVAYYSCQSDNFPLGPWDIESGDAPAPVVNYTVIYGYQYGYHCYGEGCLDTPPPAQLPDPSPLPDIESGYTPPRTYTSTKTACASCPSGQVNVGSANLLPVMTSNTAPTGEASSSGQFLEAYAAFKAFDNNPATYWASFGSAPEVDPAWLQYQFASTEIISVYAVTAITGPVTIPSPFPQGATNPKSWVLEGSNDGLAWTTLDTRSNLNFFSGERKMFIFANTIAYTYYRLVVTAVAGDSRFGDSGPAMVQIAALELYGAAATEVCKTATATSEVSQADADNKAIAAALVLAQAELTCIPIFCATEQFTARCPAGSFGNNVTKSATSCSQNSLQEAQDAARAQAQVLAEAALDCTQSNNEQEIIINDDAS